MRIMRAILVPIAACLAVMAVLDAIVAGLLAILPAVVLVALVVTLRWETGVIRHLREVARPRPDYPVIAAMEREVYGQTFRHDGAPRG
jgi:hypothetical protein